MPSRNTTIIKCAAKPDYRLFITFADGVEGEVDLKPLVGKGVFALWNQESEFQKVKIDPESGTVCWGRDIDLDPYVLRHDITGEGLPSGI